LTIAWESLQEEAFLAEAVDVGRAAVQLSGPLQLNSALDLIRNLRNLGNIQNEVGLLRESELVARWTQGTPDSGFRGLALFELAQTLNSIATKVNEPAILIDAVAAGEASLELARDPVELHLRNAVISGIQQRAQTLFPSLGHQLPPT
jgi:hypothetical protein